MVGGRIIVVVSQTGGMVGRIVVVLLQTGDMVGRIMVVVSPTAVSLNPNIYAVMEPELLRSWLTRAVTIRVLFCLHRRVATIEGD